jgi:hypothetical protein
VVYVIYIESIAVFRNVGIGVDVHVHRIANRLGWVNTAKGTPEDTREASNSHLNGRACSGNVNWSCLLPLGIRGMASKGTLERDQPPSSWIWASNLLASWSTMPRMSCQRPLPVSEDAFSCQKAPFIDRYGRDYRR